MFTTSVPLIGDIKPGEVIPTPAIGPATLGLRGVSLFFASHPAATAAVSASANTFVIELTFLFMAMASTSGQELPVVRKTAG